jgi:hypothetical protein
VLPETSPDSLVMEISGLFRDSPQITHMNLAYHQFSEGKFSEKCLTQKGEFSILSNAAAWMLWRAFACTKNQGSVRI